MILATWIETAAKGRLGGPVRAGMWSAAVIQELTPVPGGTSESRWNWRPMISFSACCQPGWIENKGGNSFWHAPIPPQAVGVRLHYRAIVERIEGDRAQTAFKTRSCVPTCRTAPSRWIRCSPVEPKVLVENRLIDNPHRRPGLNLRRLFSDGRTAFLCPSQRRRSTAKPLPLPRCDHRRPCRGPTARLDFTERTAWDPYQQYRGANQSHCNDTPNLQARAHSKSLMHPDFAKPSAIVCS